MKVSVIVPVYNTGQYLHACIQSILNQTLTDLELILIDDGSTDESGKICDSYEQQDHRVRVVHKKNAGVSAARNTGIEMAAGEYIGFVDSDDTIQPQMYESMYRAAKEHGTDIVMCDAVTVFGDCHEEPDTIRQLRSSCLVNRWTPDLLKEMAGSSCRCIYSYALIQRHSSRFPVALKFSEDRVFNIYAMGYANSLYYIKEPFYNRLIWDGSAVNRFHADYFHAVREAATATEQALTDAWENDEAYQKAYQEQFVTGAIAAINNYFYGTSPWSWREKITAVKRLCADPQLCSVMDDYPCTDFRSKLLKRKNVILLSLCAIYANIRHGRLRIMIRRPSKPANEVGG